MEIVSAPKNGEQKKKSEKAGAAVEELSMPENTLQQMDWDKIIADGKKFKNARIKFEDIAELASTIKTVGLLQPLLVWEATEKEDKGKYYLIAGFRRYKAIEMLREEDAKIFSKVGVNIFKGNETDARLAHAIENVQRKDLTYAELADGYQELVRLGLTTQEIAAKAGVSSPWVSKLVGIRQKSHTNVFKALHEGTITITIASDLIEFAQDEQLDKLKALTKASTDAATPEEAVKKVKKVREDIKNAAADAKGKAAPRPGVKKAREMLKMIEEKLPSDKGQFLVGVQKGILWALGEIKEIKRPEKTA